MANFYTDRYNRFLENASSIYDYLSGNYMNSYEGKLLDCGDFNDSIGAIRIVRIAKFRKMENDQEMLNAVREKVEGYLSSLHQNNCAACIFAISDKHEVKLFFASEVIDSTSFDSVLKNTVPDIKTDNAFVSAVDLRRLASFGGVVTGAFNLERNVVDDLLNYIKDKETVIALIAKPIARSSTDEFCYSLADVYDMTGSFENVSDGFGISSKISVSRQFPGLNILRDYIKKQYDRINRNQSDLWGSCIWFGSSDKGTAENLGGKLAGLFTAAGDSSVEKGRYYLTTDNPLKNGRLAISNARYERLDYNLPSSLIKGSLKSYVTTSELASMFQLPTRSFNGITVINVQRTANDIKLFDTFAPTVHGNTFSVGKIYGSGQDFCLSIDDFTQHALVTGGTGSGKTNTVKTLLESIYRYRIPFCVIEPSKKEYWNMVGSIKNLKIYSGGYDARKLKLNPLEPEDGIIIGNHIDDVMYALSGAFDMEEPTRLTLDGLIKYTYCKFGWDINEIARRQEKRYPTFKNVLDNLEEYSKIGIRSGKEVTANIEGSVIRRLESLITGIAGNVINVDCGISGQELCSGPVLIELDDFATDVKPFITNLLLIKMNQFLRQGDSSRGKLKNIIVLEEAHNVIPKMSLNGIKKARDISSEYFSNMLSQIRDYGTGLIIADQGASQINETTVANTKIKIMHAVTREEDADAEAFAFRLNRIQKERLPELSTGEALISVRGQESVCKVKIRKNTISNINNYACVFCRNSRFCEIDEVIDRLRGSTRGELLLSNVYRNRLDGAEIRKLTNEYFNFIKLSDNLKLCAFGYMMANINIPCGEREKRCIIFRYLEQ